MPVIQSIRSREILDSRGNPTVEADVYLTNGLWGRASVPSGASTGSKEALELRDGDRRYQGKGVLGATSHIRGEIAQALCGRDFEKQDEIDACLIALDGTAHKSRLGANALLAVSMAFARARALHLKQNLYHSLVEDMRSSMLPVPLMNIINGGAHADNNLDIQEFMIVPHGFTSFSEALRSGVEVFHTLKTILKRRGLQTGIGDEGGFAPHLRSHQEAMELILEAIHQAGYIPGKQISLALDCASNEFYREGRYVFETAGVHFEAEAWVECLETWVDQYPIISIEDGMAEEDWTGWAHLTQSLGQKIQLVGDDLFVTNTALLERGIREGIANAILIKLNQIGTVTETLSAIHMAKKAGFGTIISHRSGETSDTFIADLAVATSAGQIKAGSLCRSDRVEKYNQLLRIEEYCEKSAHYPGLQAFKTA